MKHRLMTGLFGFRNKFRMVTSNVREIGNTFELAKQSRMRNCRVPGCRFVSCQTAGTSAPDVVVPCPARKHSAPARLLLQGNLIVPVIAGRV